MMATRRADATAVPVILEVLPRLLDSVECAEIAADHAARGAAMSVMNPLLLKAFTATSCIGPAWRRRAIRCETTQRAEALCIRDRTARHARRRGGGRRRREAARRAATLRLPQQQIGGTRPAARRLRGAVEETASLRRAKANRRIHRHEHRGNPRRPNWRTANAIPRPARCRAFRLRRDPQLVLGRRLPAQAPAPRRPRHGRFLRMRIERQGVRLRAAHDRSGSDRRGPRRRSGLVVFDHPLWLSLSAAMLRRRPAVRSTWRATGYRSVKRPPLRCSNGFPARSTAAMCCCWASANRAMPITCPRRIRKGIGARRAMQAALTSASLEPGCDRLHQFARNRNAEQRSLGKPGRHQPVRPDDALQFDQGRDRPYARRGRRVGSGHQRPRAAKWLDARRRQHRMRRPDAHGALHQGKSPCPDCDGSSAIPSASAGRTAA